MANSQLFYTGVMLGKETAWGTPVARSVSIPSENPKWQPQALRHIIDTGYRALGAVDFDLIPGPGEGTFSFDCDYYPDTGGNLLLPMLGTDAVSGAGPYTHALALSATPPSDTFEWQQNTQPYYFPGARLASVKMTFSAMDNVIKMTNSGMSKLGVTTAATAFSATTALAMAGWLGSVQVGGSSPASLLEGNITFARALKPLHAMNATQDVAALYPQGLQITGQLTFDFTGVAEYNYYASASGTKNAIVLTFVQSSTAKLIITITKAAWKLVDLTPNDNIYTAVAQFNGIYNATDAGPCAVTIVNSQAAAY